MIEGRIGLSGSMSKLLGSCKEIGSDLTGRVYLAGLRSLIWLLTIDSRADDKEARR